MLPRSTTDTAEALLTAETAEVPLVGALLPLTTVPVFGDTCDRFVASLLIAFWFVLQKKWVMQEILQKILCFLQWKVETYNLFRNLLKKGSTLT